MKDSNLKIGVEPFCKFYWMCFGAGLMHLTYIITFIIFKMGMLMTFNIFSVLIYVIAGLITRKTDLQRYGLSWIWIIYGEVLLHALLCTLVQGMEVAFFLFPMMIMPLCSYYLFIYCDKKTFFKTLAIMSIITVVSLAVVIVHVEAFGTVYELTEMHVLKDYETITIRAVNLVFTFFIMAAFTVIFYLEVSRLFGKLRESNSKLNYIATHDSLTGLSNRHSLWKFFEDLEQSNDHYCIIMGDLDDFKKINDTYGHDCGDVVLKSVAGVILDNIGENDMACRWGGEEMLIVMRGERDYCFERLGKIKSEICSLGVVHEETPVKVTMTFGFAGCEEKNDSYIAADAELVKSTVRTPSHIGVESLISMVDKRLYTGKRSGKNVIVAA